jgi:5'-methylthioadenosine phosphorylase
MEFAALCTVDNYANGLGGEVLTYGHILSTARENRSRTEEIVTTIITDMG